MIASFSIDAHQWLTVAGISLLAILTPGPDFAIVLRNSIAHGIRAGLLTAAGIALGLSFHVAYTMAGIAVIVAHSVVLFSIIKWIGAAYLIWVGIQALRSRPHNPDAGEATPSRARNAFLAGFLTNVLNPKATLFFLALFTQVLDPDTALGTQAVYGATIMLQAFAVFSSLAIAVGQPAARRTYGRIGHWIERAAGTAFIALGVRLAFVRAVD